MLSNGIDTDFFHREESQRKRFRIHYGYGTNDKIVLCVGLPIERKKGIIDVISIAKQMPEIQFCWCGHIDSHLLPKRINKAISKAPKNLLFLGFLNSEELRNAYGGSDLFLFLTHEKTKGIVMLEALAMKIPVLVRDIPVYEKWLESDVHVYKAKQNSDFCNKIREILFKHLPDLTINGRLLAEKKDFKKIAIKIKNIYHRILNETT